MGFGVFGPRSKSWLHHEFSASHLISLSLSFLTCRMRIISLSYRRSVNTSIIKVSTVLCPAWRWDHALFILRAWDWGWIDFNRKKKASLPFCERQNKTKAKTQTQQPRCVLPLLEVGRVHFPAPISPVGQDLTCPQKTILSTEDYVISCYANWIVLTERDVACNVSGFDRERRIWGGLVLLWPYIWCPCCAY